MLALMQDHEEIVEVKTHNPLEIDGKCGTYLYRSPGAPREFLPVWHLGCTCGWRSMYGTARNPKPTVHYYLPEWSETQRQRYLRRFWLHAHIDHLSAILAVS